MTGLRRARRRTAVTTCALLTVVACMLPIPASTAAGWVGAENATGRFATGIVAPPTGLVCSVNQAQSTVTFSWRSPVGGLTRIGYTWDQRDPSPGGVQKGGVLGVEFRSYTFRPSLPAVGSGRCQISAIGPGGWRSAPLWGTVSRKQPLRGSTEWGCSVPRGPGCIITQGEVHVNGWPRAVVLGRQREMLRRLIARVAPCRGARALAVADRRAFGTVASVLALELFRLLLATGVRVAQPV